MVVLTEHSCWRRQLLELKGVIKGSVRAIEQKGIDHKSNKIILVLSLLLIQFLLNIFI